MTYKVEIMYGTEFTGDGRKLADTIPDLRFQLERIHITASRAFGGVTVVTGRGGWIDPRTGKLAYETSETLICYSEDTLEFVRAWVNRIAQHARALLSQDVVLVTITPIEELLWVNKQEETK